MVRTDGEVAKPIAQRAMKLSCRLNPASMRELSTRDSMTPCEPRRTSVTQRNEAPQHGKTWMHGNKLATSVFARNCSILRRTSWAIRIRDQGLGSAYRVIRMDTSHAVTASREHVPPKAQPSILIQRLAKVTVNQVHSIPVSIEAGIIPLCRYSIISL